METEQKEVFVSISQQQNEFLSEFAKASEEDEKVRRGGGASDFQSC